MSKFSAYTHIERLSSDSCEGILNGHCIVQAKVDSTNACVWHDDTCPEQYRLRCGSRKRGTGAECENSQYLFHLDNTPLSSPSDPLSDRCITYHRKDYLSNNSIISKFTIDSNSNF